GFVHIRRLYRNEVPATDIINISIAVVINTVPWHLTGVYPDVVFQVRMVVVDTGVDNRNGDVRATLLVVPDSGHVGLNSRDRRELAVIGNGLLNLYGPVHFGPFHPGIFFQSP